MRMHPGVVVAAAACAVACSKADHESGKPPAPTPPAPTSQASGIEIPTGFSAAQRIAAEQARDALHAACAATPIDWNEFKEVSLTTSNASGYLKDQFDWEPIVTIALVYKDGLDRRRGNHRLTFNFGAGKRPGIVTNKSHGIELCGFTGRARGVVSGKPCEPEGAEDCILDVPSLKVLDAARPPAVIETDRTAPLAWCFGAGFDPPAFWKCTSTEKTCKRARVLEKRDENGDYKVRTECSRTETLHCFASESGATVCAPDATVCAASRKEWTNSATATPCEVATPAQLEASNRETG